MSNYTVTTNFTAKDSLPSGDPGKLIKGADFGTEFTNISTAINDNTTDITALEAFRSAITASTAELNNTTGTTSNIQAQLDENLFDFSSSATAIYGSTSAKQDGGVFLQNAGSNGSGSAHFIDVSHANTLPNSYYAAFRYLGTAVGSITRSSSTGVSYNTSSDYRLKENVTPINNATNRVKELNPCRFNFKGEQRIVDGFLAHEAQQVVPESVVGDKDAVDDEGNPMYQGIDQSKIVPLLTAALQEAIARIEALEGNQ